MTGKKFKDYVRLKTGTDAETFPDSEILLYMNLVKDDIVKDLAEANEDIFGMLAYRNLVADQREYSIPENLLNNTKYFEIDIEGTGRYVRMNELDLTQYGRSTEEDAIRKAMSGRAPMFDIFRDSFWIYSTQPIVAVNDGLKLFYIRYPDNFPLDRLDNDLADLSNNLILPISSGVTRELHMVWATKVIIMYKESKDRPMALTQYEQNVDIAYLKVFKAITGRNLDRVHQAKVPTHDYGMNY